MPVPASGIEHSTSAQTIARRRVGVVMIVASNQKKAIAFRYWSVRSLMLPVGQTESGIVITDHATSASAMPISGAIGVIGCLWAVRSKTWAAIATPAARNAIRITLRIGNHACGDRSSTHVKKTSARNAVRLPVRLAGTRRAADRGLHHVAPAFKGAAIVFTVALQLAGQGSESTPAATAYRRSRHACGTSST